MNNVKHTHFIKNIAQQNGFNYCGIARAELLNNDARKLESLVEQRISRLHATTWKNYFDLRIDPTKIISPELSLLSLY